MSDEQREYVRMWFLCNAVTFVVFVALCLAFSSMTWTVVGIYWSVALCVGGSIYWAKQ